MKGFTQYMQTAIMSQFMKHFNNRVFAENVVEHLRLILEEDVTIEDTKSSGMVLRVKRDSVADSKKVQRAVIAAMRDMIELDNEEFETILVVQYEFQFDMDMIDTELLDNTLDIKRKNRQIFIEVDI